MNKLPRKIHQGGKTLVELILFFGVFMLALVLSIAQVQEQSELVFAQAVGQQMSFVGDALDTYTTRHYKQLLNLQSSPAPRFTGDFDSAAGERTCDSYGCDISMDALRHENILPATYSNTNLYGAGYKLRVVRRVLQANGCGTQGDQPCYKLTGIAITDTPFYFNSAQGFVGRIRYDLLGAAVESAGTHHGFTPPNSATTVSGVGNSWSEGSADFPAINQFGLLAARRGYETNLDSEYVRRDGTLPMTGDLNMMHVDGVGQFYKHNILNLNTINATRFITGDVLMPSVFYGSQDGQRNTYMQQGGEVRVADSDGNPGIIRAADMFISNRTAGQIPLSLMLPTSSLRGSYWVKDNETVPKPYCEGNGANGVGANSVAKLVLFPGIQQILTMSWNRRMRLTEGNCPSDSVWTTWARDNGDHWTINVGSYATNNGGGSDSDGNMAMVTSTTPMSRSADGTQLNYMLAQTFCDYRGAQNDAPREIRGATWTQYGNTHYQCVLGGIQFVDGTKRNWTTGAQSTNSSFSSGVVSFNPGPPQQACDNALFASATYGNNANHPNPLVCAQQGDGTWTCSGRMAGFYNQVGCRVDAAGGILSLFGS